VVVLVDELYLLSSLAWSIRVWLPPKHSTKPLAELVKQ